MIMMIVIQRVVTMTNVIWYGDYDSPEMCAHWNESLEGKLARWANPPGWPGRPARKKVLYTRPLKIFTLFARQYSSLPAEGWTEASGLESSAVSED